MKDRTVNEEDGMDEYEDCVEEGKKKDDMGWWKRRSTGEKVGIVIGLGILGLGAATGLFILFGNIVCWLWNWIMPYLFSLPKIDFWMAWGIVALSMILFGRASGSSSSSETKKSAKRKKQIKARMEEMPEAQA